MMCNEVDENLEKFLEDIETKTGESINDEICKLLRELKNNSEKTIKDLAIGLERYLTGLVQEDKIHNDICYLLNKIKTDAEKPKNEIKLQDYLDELRNLAKAYDNHKNICDQLKKLEDQLTELPEVNKIFNDSYYNHINSIKEAIKKYILESEKTKKYLSKEKEEYYDSLLDYIQYLIIYKLCFLMVIRKQEVDWIIERRKIADKWTTGKKIKSTHEEARDVPYNDSMGLALSGGGIRSAAFNLGLLQALERCNILKSVDYLSSVSGGGYIASSLTWFMSKDENSFPFGKSRRDHSGKSGKILSWLRDHGNYLTPGNGKELPSLIVAMLTSVLINMLIILPPSLSLLWIFQYLQNHQPCIAIYNWSFKGGLFFLIITFLFSVMINVGSSLKICCLIRQLYRKFKAEKLHKLTGNTFIKCCRKGKSYREFKAEKLHKLTGIIFITGLLLLVFGMIPDIYKFLNEHIGKWMAAISLSGITSFFAAFKGLKESNETKGFRSLLLTVGLSLIVFGVFLGMYHIIYIEWVEEMWLFGLLFVSLILSFLSDINHISIHRYYRNRLMEAFMPWAIIGENRSKSDKCFLAEIPKTRSPYHIINTTVNMVGSEKTKQRERGGDSFILSPLFCGSEATGYAATNEYVEGGIDLATAFAVSGAAVNPNTYVTRSKPITFLMSLFNTRLGYWIKNPSCSSFQENTLHWHYFKYIIYEMFGRGLNETNDYVHLSDGGHFENLGLYELVRRRCQYIIVSDASNDPNWTFGDLARAIEMVRVDFGAEVNLDTRPLQPKGETRIADQGSIRGTVTYKDGKIADLIYINTVIIDGLPEDIYSYRRTNQRFPDQTTSDQFFDEKQFEAYRELGFQLGFDLCGRTSHEDFTAIFKMNKKDNAPQR